MNMQSACGQTIPEYVFRESGQQMVRRLHAELAADNALLWFSVYPPMMNVAAIRWINGILIVCWVLAALFGFGILPSPGETVWFLLGAAMFGSLIWLIAGVNLMPKQCVCLDLKRKSIACYHKGRLDRQWMLNEHYGLWHHAYAIHLTHAHYGEQSELLVCEGFVPQADIALLAKNLSGRLGLRMVYPKP